MRLQVLTPLVLCSVLASCVTVPPITTPSGRPECTVERPSADVQAYCLERFIGNGWMLKSQSPNQLVLWKESDSELQNVLLGSAYDPTTTNEVRLVFTNSTAGTRVLGQVALITNEGSAFERRDDLTSGKAGYELWQALCVIADHFSLGQSESQPSTTAAAQ